MLKYKEGERKSGRKQERDEIVREMKEGRWRKEGRIELEGKNVMEKEEEEFDVLQWTT